MKTRRRIRRIIRELQERQLAGAGGRRAGISVVGQQDAYLRLNEMRWNNYRGTGS
ncbi:MAG: hypothetical protein M1321_01310 [Candidatus Marsarchaeota archaeon]|nr:hypothetical protein [Candidatus Marsarchaeota archaeon]